jgi:DNA-binding MarR family transcriptional regulator
MRALSGELGQADGMSLSSYYALLHLARAPKRRLRMTELAEAVVLSPSGLTRLVERLEREGLVARIKSADDARGAYAMLTDRGHARLRKATRPHLTGI